MSLSVIIQIRLIMKIVASLIVIEAEYVIIIMFEIRNLNYQLVIFKLILKHIFQ